LTKKGVSFAGAAARMGGDCNPNMPSYLSPAAIGHLSRWFALPWCAATAKVEAATAEAATAIGSGGETAGSNGLPSSLPPPAVALGGGCPRRGNKAMLALKPIGPAAGDGVSGDGGAGAPIKLAQRQLLAFPVSQNHWKLAVCSVVVKSANRMRQVYQHRLWTTMDENSAN